MTFTLRPYQSDAISAILPALDRFQLVCYQLNTGGGKTIIIAQLARLLKGQPIIVVAHRQEIIKQIHEKLAMAGVEAGIIAPWAAPKPWLDVQVASIQTYRAKPDSKRYYLMIIDEAHHATADSYLMAIEKCQAQFVLGVTATPCRTNGKPLGDLFKHLICGPTVPELQAMGALCRYEAFAPAEDNTRQLKIQRGDFIATEAATAMEGQGGTVYGDILATWEGLSMGKKTIAFGPTIEWCEMMAKKFWDAGHKFSVVHGKLPPDHRAHVIDMYRRGDLTGLWNVDIVGEGFDLPECETAILARPTASAIVYLQQVGRVLRPAPGKEKALILDHACNMNRHGKPDMIRVWDLGVGIEARKCKTEQLVKVCRKCSFVNTIQAMHCESCGEVFHQTRKITVKQADMVQGDLLVAGEQKSTILPGAPAWVHRYKNKKFKDLLIIARKSGRKPGWAYVMAKQLRKWGVEIDVPSFQKSMEIQKQM